MGVETLDFSFATTKRHFLAQSHVVWRICVKIGARVSAVAFVKNQKTAAESLCADGREITHAQKQNPWTDLDKILHGDIPNIVTDTNFGDH